MWTLTHADAPALRDVLVHVAKDCAPGVEAARKTIIPKSRPVHDFFHFMGKETELTAKCEILAVAGAGKHCKMNCDCIRSVLYDIQNTPTADWVNLIWKGFFMRLLCMGKVDVALYLWTSYSKEYHVSTLWNMGVFTNATNREDTLHLLSWWSGFPGFNCGSANAEALHSAWQRELKNTSGAFDIPETLSFMQRLCVNTWQHQFRWASPSQTNRPERTQLSLMVNSCMLWIGQLQLIFGRSNAIQF